MIHVTFKNLEKSELAREAVIEKLEPLLAKFEDIRESHVRVTLEMDNSPTQAGPDLFHVKLHVPEGRYAGTTLKKSDSNLYRALADLADHVLEKLNRAGDRTRVRARTKARHIVRAST